MVKLRKDSNNAGLVHCCLIWILICLALSLKVYFPRFIKIYLVCVMVDDILIPPIPCETGPELPGHTHCWTGPSLLFYQSAIL